MNENIVVMKFGGTSVGNAERMRKVAAYVVSEQQKGICPVIVVSAMGKATDQDIVLFNSICPGGPQRELDALLSTGEMRSAALLAGAIETLNGKALSFTAAQMKLIAAGAHGRGRIVGLENTETLRDLVAKGIIPVCAGFQGVQNGDFVTLGRGGSDTTAVAVAHELHADACNIYTDVAGVYTTDPRVVPSARRFAFVDYTTMLSLSSAGAGVLMDRAVLLAQRFGVRLRVLLSPSIGDPDEGTIVYFRDERLQAMEAEGDDLTGLAIRQDVVAVTFPGLPNRPGQAHEIFEALKEVVVGDAVQGSGTEDVASISCWVAEEDSSRVKGAVPKCEIQDAACLTLVSPALKEGSGYLARMTGALGKVGVNIEMISSAGTSVLVIIRRADIAQAAQAVAQEFDLCEKGG
ncbi:MAG: aspartate kinase [bacterium]|nr:aspartate kinase [bacterium]